MILSRKRRLVLAYFVVIPALLVVVGYMLFAKYRPLTSPTPTSSPSPTIASVEISDQSLGLAFSIDKTFTRLDTAAMQTENPTFLYDFRPADVANVSCVVSQTKRLQPGEVAIQDLVNGTVDQIKKSNPDVALLSWKNVATKGGVHGGWMELTFTDNKIAVKRAEIVATTDTRTTFAFCTSPQSLFEVYRPTFESFLRSLSVQ